MKSCWRMRENQEDEKDFMLYNSQIQKINMRKQEDVIGYGRFSDSPLILKKRTSAENIDDVSGEKWKNNFDMQGVIFSIYQP